MKSEHGEGEALILASRELCLDLVRGLPYTFSIAPEGRGNKKAEEVLDLLKREEERLP